VARYATQCYAPAENNSNLFGARNWRSSADMITRKREMPSLIGRPLVRLAGRSDQSDVVFTRYDSRIGSWNQTCLILPIVGPIVRTKRLHGTIVGPTGRSDDRTV